MKILYFAPIDWEYIRQRPQHLAKRLSDTFEFLYIQPLGLRNLGISDFKRAIKRFLGLFRNRRTESSLKVISPIFIPVINLYIQRINARLLRKQLRSLADKETIVWVTTPSKLILDVLTGMKFKALVYEMLDDYPGFHASQKKDITATETLLVNKADLIIATSSALLEKATSINMNKEIVCLSNGVDYEFFDKSRFSRPAELAGMDKIIGYMGSIDNWIDIEIISFLADNMKDLNFVFIGPLRIRNLPVRKNIHYLGKKDYNVIPQYCNCFNVCLIPFRPGEFADMINPVKLYEYFALGKPVVASRMKELMPLSELLYIAEDKEDFLKKLKLAVSENDAVVRSKRKELARLNDWTAKAASIREALLRL
jgi:teichuronic acid biosynthesis glycosyltransferase TuaH